jgi:hypothetical protein
MAKALGRRRDKRGKEPTYISDLLRTSRPITIPAHPGTLATGTANAILDRFEEDIFELEEQV